MRFQQGRPIVALDGVETMNDAEALAGAELKVPAEGLGPLPERTYYRHDLVGCEVRTKDGQVVGKVTAVEGPLERSRLVIAGQGGEVMVPMVERHLRQRRSVGEGHRDRSARRAAGFVKVYFSS